MSTRLGGLSQGPYASLNLGVAVGDEANSVLVNRAIWARALNQLPQGQARLPTEPGAASGARVRPVWLRQVHGAQVLRLQASTPDQPQHAADAAFTTEPGLACTIQVADCMPVLLASTCGQVVAAAHAGWRGLAAGVLEHTLEAMCSATGLNRANLQAWLGPCIGPERFEVGADVLQAFALPAHQDQRRSSAQWPCRYAPRADGSARWLLNLPELVRQRLMRAGLPIEQVHASYACTAGEPHRFFSYRREGTTGRMAASIWRWP